jgi:hypothetical protein
LPLARRYDVRRRSYLRRATALRVFAFSEWLDFRLAARIAPRVPATERGH